MVRQDVAEGCRSSAGYHLLLNLDLQSHSPGRRVLHSHGCPSPTTVFGFPVPALHLFTLASVLEEQARAGGSSHRPGREHPSPVRKLWAFLP